MNGLILILKVIGWLIVITTGSYIAVLILNVWKQIKWEKHLDGYKVNGDGTVTNKQGVRLTSAEWLLEDLKGYEERITK